MHNKSHRHNGISILWLCATNHTDTMELQVSGYAQLTTQIQLNFQPYGYAQLTTDTMEFHPSGYAPLTQQIQWNYNYLVMHY